MSEATTVTANAWTEAQSVTITCGSIKITDTVFPLCNDAIETTITVAEQSVTVRPDTYHRPVFYES